MVPCSFRKQETRLKKKIKDQIYLLVSRIRSSGQSWLAHERTKRVLGNIHARTTTNIHQERNTLGNTKY